jgi:tetratricopeptide (TPR) repeat protein
MRWIAQLVQPGSFTNKYRIKFVNPILFCTFEATKNRTIMTKHNQHFSQYAVKAFPLIFSLFCFFSSCHSDRGNNSLLPELVQVESVMYAHPDSAFHILSEMRTIRKEDKLQYATWALLMTQAKYKLFITQDDSLVNVALDYFQKRKDPQRKALSFYLKGSLYTDNGQSEDALPYLLQASKEVEQTDDYQLAHLIFRELCDIYAYRGLNEYASVSSEKALKYALKSGNKKYIMSAYQAMARVSRCQNQYSQEADYYEHAIRLSIENDLYQDEANLLTEMANTYRYLGDTLKSIQAIKESVHISEAHSLAISPQQYYTLGESYLQVGNDSAFIYLSKALENANLYNQFNANMCLYQLFSRKHDYKKGLEYLETSITLLDSIRHTENSTAIVEMKQKYDQQKVINEKMLVEMRKDAVINKFLLVSILLICVIALLTFIYFRNIRRKRLLIQETDEKTRALVLELQKNEMTIRQNQRYIDDLSEQLRSQNDVQEHMEETTSLMNDLMAQNKALESINDNLRQDKESYMRSLKIKNEELVKMDELSIIADKQQNRIHYLEGLLVEKNDMLHKVKHFHVYLNSSEWVQLYHLMDLVFSSFTSRLNELIPTLTETELKLCCLIKLHLSNKEIASVLSISNLSVGKYKQRLRSHILNSTALYDGSKSLDLWIWDL